LPFVTAIERDDSEVEAIRAVVKDAIADPATGRARQALRLTGLGAVDEWDYWPIAGLSQQIA